MRVTPGLGLLNRSVVDQDRLDSVEVVLDRSHHEIGYPLLVPQSATCEIENHLVSSETTMNPIATKKGKHQHRRRRHETSEVASKNQTAHCSEPQHHRWLMPIDDRERRVGELRHARRISRRGANLPRATQYLVIRQWGVLH